MSVYPGVSVLTLSVRDLPRAQAFYERLGWRLSKAMSSRTIAFFALNNLTLALHIAPQHAPQSAPNGGAVTMTQCHGGPRSVDAALSHALAAGGTLIAGAQATSWGGYVARFADPEGYVWELASDPRVDLGHDGTLTLPP